MMIINVYATNIDFTEKNFPKEKVLHAPFTVTGK